jgi:hypothetical protein
LTVSEQQAEATIGETGSINARPSDSPSSDVKSEPLAAAAPAISVVEAPLIAPDHEAPKADEAKIEASRIEVPKAEAPRMNKLLFMERASESKTEGSPTPGKRRFAAMAAGVALATSAGALGGALATAGIGHLVTAAEATSPANSTLEASIARIDADILALKAGLEHTSKMEMGQFNKTSDRLDRLEKAQAEPAAKLARLSEAVDKLRAAPAAAPAAVAAAPAAPAASKEVTGAVAPPQAAASAAPAPAAAAPKTEVGRLPTVEGWVLTDVGYGGALIENRRGSYEVYAGDTVPGLGRIDAIRRQDGRWVVVTSKGLITKR